MVLDGMVLELLRICVCAACPARHIIAIVSISAPQRATSDLTSQLPGLA